MSVNDTFAAAEARVLGRLRVSGSLDALNDAVRLYREARREDRLRMLLHPLAAGTRDLEARALVHVYLGQSYERGAEWATAIEVYRAGIGLEPCRPFAAYFLHNNLAYCLNARDEHREAARLCRIAISIDPLRYNAHKNLGVAMAGLGRRGEAFRHYLQAALLEPADGRALKRMQQLAMRYPEALERPGDRARLQACLGLMARARCAARRDEPYDGYGEDAGFSLEEFDRMACAARERGHDCIVVRRGRAGVPEVLALFPLDADLGDWVHLTGAERDDVPAGGRVILKHADYALLRCEAGV